MAGLGETGTLVYSECKMVEPLRKILRWSFKKFKIGWPHDPAIPPHDILQRQRMQSQRDVYTPLCAAAPKAANAISKRRLHTTVCSECRVSKRRLHTSVCSSTAHSQPSVGATQAPINRGLDKQNVVQRNDGLFPAKCSLYMQWNVCFLKRKIIPTRATTWMSVEDTMLSEISRLQKDKPSIIPRKVFGVVEITDRMVVPRGGRERGMRGCCLMGIERVLVSQQEKNSGDMCVSGGWGDRIHNDVDVLSTAALHAKIATMVIFILYGFCY